VLAVVESGALTRGELQRAAQRLQAIDPAAVGLVVNRVAPIDGGYVRELMLESVTGVRADRFFTLPRWRLLAAAWAARLQRARA
jgi:polysaccharide biosynthesis transport protein